MLLPFGHQRIHIHTAAKAAAESGVEAAAEAAEAADKDTSGAAAEAAGGDAPEADAAAVGLVLAAADAAAAHPHAVIEHFLRCVWIFTQLFFLIKVWSIVLFFL